MRIQELEGLVGIERATIRFYEKEGLITPARSENGYRDYSEEDAAELRRIKLLRELGVSLDTIRRLQAGREDFTAVMERQCRILESRREQMERARQVCLRISADGVSYAAMDIDRYQNLLNAPTLPAPAAPAASAVFEEKDIRQPHPWRRFFARFMDYDLTRAVLWLIFIVVLRWRFTSDLVTTLVAFSIWFIQIPIEAAWIHFLGTTPGKWLFGIRVEAIEGGKLTYGEALERACKALHTGMGLNIPLVRLWCFWKGYKAHKENWDNEWDEYSEVSFRGWNWTNWVLIVAAYAAALGLQVASEVDAQLPKYRSNELTVTQFAKNYNFYDEFLLADSQDFMEPDGTLRERNYTEEMVLPDYGNLEYAPYAQFEYDLEGDTIRAIRFRHTWYERDSYTNYFVIAGGGSQSDSLGKWLPSYCRLALITAAASQEGVTAGALETWLEQMNEDLKRPAAGPMTCTYGSVTCTWDLETELFLDYPEDSTTSDVYEVTVDLVIEFP